MNKLLIFAILFLFAAGYASAYSVVTGHVYDAGNSPVNGATVDVTCNSNVEHTTSNNLGLYIVSFTDDLCPYDTAVHVVATKDTQTGSNDGYTCESADICDGIPVALVNVTIPEFGVIAGVAALIGALAVFVFKRK
jgi:hypothetical protein